MTGIFAQALGADFERLHPEVQRRFGLSSEQGVACIGRGVMSDVWRGPAWTVPFLHLGAWRHILIPVQGNNIPFTVENYPYVDRLGRESYHLRADFRGARQAARARPIRRHDGLGR